MAATPRRRRAAAPRRRVAAIACGRAACAGIVRGVPALVASIVFAARFATFVAHSTSAFTTFGKCIAKAGNRSVVFSCIARRANDIRP